MNFFAKKISKKFLFAVLLLVFLAGIFIIDYSKFQIAIKSANLGFLFSVQTAKAASTVTVNADKTISVNGTKFFPISLYINSDWTGALGMGINSASDPFCVHTADLLGSIKKCEANSVYCHLTVGPDCDDVNGPAVGSGNLTPFVDGVNRLKGYSYLLGYGLPDEPVAAFGLSPAKTKAAYDAIKAADPNHLVFFTDYKNLSGYGSSGDVFLDDEYPFGNGGEDLYTIKTQYQSMISQVSPKPAWLIIQAGSQFGMPTEAQIRAETYLSIALGSTGIIFYSWDEEDSNIINISKDGNKVFIKNFISELKSFSPYFLAPTSSSLSYSSSDVDAILKSYGGKLYLIAVNKNAAAKSITFTINGAGTTTAKIIGTAAAGSARTGTNISVSSDKLTDNLGGLEAVVYEIGAGGGIPTPTPTPTPTSIPTSTPISTPMPTPTPVLSCVESWTCAPWSACVGGNQTRACTDSNSCGTTVSKPAVSSTCVLPPLKSVKVNLFSVIVSGLINWFLMFAAGLAVLMIIIGGIRYIRSWGDTEETEKAKKMITYVILGIVIIIISYSVIVTVDKIING